MTKQQLNNMLGKRALVAMVLAIPSALMLNYIHSINEAYSLGFIAGIVFIMIIGGIDV